MAVADVPSELGQMPGVAAAYVEQLFLRRDDACETPVVEDKAVAAAQRYRFVKIDEQPVAAAELDDPAAQMALVMGQHGDVERGWSRLAGASHRHGTQHFRSLAALLG